MTLDLSKFLPPSAWTEDLETLPFKAGRYEAMTAKEAVAKYLQHPYGDEIVTVSYEKEVFFKGDGWEWVEYPQEEATLARLAIRSQLSSEAAERWAQPLGAGYSSGYNDRT